MNQLLPFILAFIGGMFGVVGISLYIYMIPKLGVSSMVSIGLCGQLIFSIIAGHFGWFNLPVDPITIRKIIGSLAMILGIIFINSK